MTAAFEINDADKADKVPAVRVKGSAGRYIGNRRQRKRRVTPAGRRILLLLHGDERVPETGREKRFPLSRCRAPGVASP